MKNILHKKWVWVFIIVAAIFTSLQFIRPRIINPAVTADIAASAPVKQILRNACYDCHSNETKLSWFDQIVPAYWLVADHIRDGRRVLNFSESNNLTPDQQKGIWFESLNQMQFKVMPLQQYVFLHPAAKIDTMEINVLKSYLSTLIHFTVSDTAKTRTWNEQYSKWIREALIQRGVKPALNGIAFIPEYKDWVAISSTERLDNGTLRVIMGNDMAVNAIKTNHTNPWPDGTTFAKIAWSQVADSAGIIYAGDFKQVEFMIKDKNKYASGDGWGFARWVKGLQLEPYGKSALFTTECENCHRPMKENDFVFTTPFNLETEYGPQSRLINSGADDKEGTLFTLYGNDTVAQIARTHAVNEYSPGSALTLITWIQKEDPHWFGAQVPGVIKSVERVRFKKTNIGTSMPVYEKYEGKPLEKVSENRLSDVKGRLNFILNQRASVLP